MSTLYDEIVKILEKNGKSLEDIKFVSSKRQWEEDKFEVPVNLFLEKCKLIHPVATSPEIQIVGDDFWLDSDSADGYFDFFSIPQKPSIVADESYLAKTMLQEEEEADQLKLLGIMFEDFDEEDA